MSDHDDEVPNKSRSGAEDKLDSPEVAGDLGGGEELSESRRDQLKVGLDHYKWKNWFAKLLAFWTIGVASILLGALLGYIFSIGSDMKVLHIPVFFLLGSIPTALSIAMMRFFLPRNIKESSGSDWSTPQVEMAKTLVESATKLVKK